MWDQSGQAACCLRSRPCGLARLAAGVPLRLTGSPELRHMESTSTASAGASATHVLRYDVLASLQAKVLLMSMDRESHPEEGAFRNILLTFGSLPLSSNMIHGPLSHPCRLEVGGQQAVDIERRGLALLTFVGGGWNRRPPRSIKPCWRQAPAGTFPMGIHRRRAQSWRYMYILYLFSCEYQISPSTGDYREGGLY